MKRWVTEYIKKKPDGCDALYGGTVFGNTFEEAQDQANILGLGKVVGSDPVKLDYDTLEEIPFDREGN